MNKKNNTDNRQNSTNINWYPGHMAKTKRLIKENLNLIDVIYEVIDARIPNSSKIRDIEDVISSKPRVLIMTKYDLCDKKETNKFISYYEDKGYYVLSYDLTSNDSLDDVYNLSTLILREKLLKKKEKGINFERIRALVIGIPNAGKSTLINKLVGRKITVTGNKPGVTKQLNWVRVKDNLELLDSPGILWPKLNQNLEAYNLAATTAIKEEILEKEDIAVHIIKMLYKYYPEKLEKHYDVFDIEDFEEVFDIIGKKYGAIKKGNITNYDRVVDIIINDIKSGRIKDITFDRIEDIN